MLIMHRTHNSGEQSYRPIVHGPVQILAGRKGNSCENVKRISRNVYFFLNTGTRMFLHLIQIPFKCLEKSNYR
jgi:hypothetical protein